MASPARLAAIYQQIGAALEEYRLAREDFVMSKVRHESTREKFAGLRKLASEMLPRADWARWQEENKDVLFMGMALGDAILAVLDEAANDSAWEAVKTDDPAKAFHPLMTVDAIVARLERGGFEFRTITPRREVNGALLKLDGVVKQYGSYKKADADDTLKHCIGFAEAMKGDDDVPF